MYQIKMQAKVFLAKISIKN